MCWEGSHDRAFFTLSIVKSGQTLVALLTMDGEPQKVRTVSTAGEKLMLAVSLESGGAEFPADLTLTADGDVARMRIALLGGLAHLDGRAERKHRE